MKNLITLAAVAAVSSYASAQDFPFDTFPGQVPDAPFATVIDTPVLEPAGGLPISVMVLDVDGDGRFDYMGTQGTNVALDGYHTTGDWMDTTGPTLFSEAQMLAFDYTINATEMPMALAGITGEWTSADSSATFTFADDYDSRVWNTPRKTIRYEGCSGNFPVLCATEGRDFDGECLWKLYLEFAKEHPDRDRRNCTIVIIDKNDRLRIKPGNGQVGPKTVKSCGLFGKDYEFYILCDHESKRPVLQYEDDQGNWVDFPFFPRRPGGTFVVDKYGNPGTVGDYAPLYGPGMKEVPGIGRRVGSPYGGSWPDDERAHCWWGQNYLHHLTCKTGHWQWVEH
jgi:hypothetical protein